MQADALWYDNLTRRESFESNETTCCNLGLFETYVRWLLGGTRRIRYWIIYFYLYLHLIFWIALFLDCTKRRMFVCVWNKIISCLCQDVWVLTPLHHWPSNFFAFFSSLFFFYFLDKVVDPGLQCLHVATPVMENEESWRKCSLQYIGKLCCKWYVRVSSDPGNVSYVEHVI